MSNYSVKNYDFSEKYIDRALLKNPELPHMVRNKGNIHYLKQDYQEALKFYQSALNLTPSSSSYLVSISKTYTKLGNNDLAEANLKKAADLDIKNYKLHESLADLYLKNNNMTEAKRTLDHVLLLKPAYKAAKIKKMKIIRNLADNVKFHPRNKADYYSSQLQIEGNIVDMQLWTTGMKYAEELLPLFKAPFITLTEAIGKEDPYTALRHDVDWPIENAYTMALLEAELGICSTYFLINPDGDISPNNYFGKVEDNKLIIHETLYDWCNRLIDLGHEVGWHNDIISLALHTRTDPKIFLEQIMNGFVQKNIPVTGSVAHGSSTCAKYDYINYEIFSNFKKSSKPKFIEANGYKIPRYTLKMEDYGLLYEANSMNFDFYISDSAAQWRYVYKKKLEKLEKFDKKELLLTPVKNILKDNNHQLKTQVLVHSCHWNSILQFNQRNKDAVKKNRDLAFL